MRLESLKLTNFRGFSSFEISFDPQFTVLVGQNMAGKSAVIDAAAIACSRLLVRYGQLRTFNAEDVHRVLSTIGGTPDLHVTYPVIIEVTAASEILPLPSVAWQIIQQGGDEPTLDSAPLEAIANDVDVLPLIAQYGVQRSWLKDTAPEDLRGVGSRFDGYAGCFNILSTHSRLAGWVRRQTMVQLQRGKGDIQPQLACVEAAVISCINGVSRFWFDLQYDELRLERTNGDIQSFSMLSEGVRNAVAMVADIAWRAAVLNPQFGERAHLETSGVVMIDELELHLHPAWQRRVVDDLRRTFPKLQFIVTTHSPQIVASVSRQQVRLLHANQLVADGAYVEGRNTNEILEDVFGVPARPETTRAEIDQLYRMLEDEQFEAARRQLAILSERLGPDDSDIVRARWLLDTEEAPAQSPPSSSP